MADADDEDEDADAAARDDDERNVFYVALTRARKEVFVTMAKADREGKELVPTQFISEMRPGREWSGEGILAECDTSPYEKEFDKRRAELEFGAEGDGEKAAAKAPQLEDKAFLNALFEQQGISVTALNNYLECPWAYFYRNLVRIPEAPNKHLSFGNAVHAALKNYFDEFDKGEDLGKAYLIRRFEEALAREPIPEHEYEETLEKGRKALPAFFDEYHEEWLAFRAKGGRGMNEVRVDGVAANDGTPINGKLDRMEFQGPGEASVRVIDYKTGRPKSRNEIEGGTKDADGNYKRQLVFYKLLLGKQGLHDMAEGVIVFVEPDGKGKSHREPFDVTQGEVTVLEKLVTDVAREIQDLAFWNKGCHQPDCAYCKLREGMG